MKKKIITALLTIFSIFSLDQISKKWIMMRMSRDWLSHLTLNVDHIDIIEVTDFFNLILTFNRGVSFSMFQAGSEKGVWILIALTSLLSLFIGYLCLKTENRVESVSYALIAGGALGNLFDRVTLGAVVDFLDFHVKGYHFPAFNVADSAICMGACLLFLHQFMIYLKHNKKVSL